jgi:hypothetical protein
MRRSGVDLPCNQLFIFNSSNWNDGATLEKKSPLIVSAAQHLTQGIFLSRNNILTDQNDYALSNNRIVKWYINNRPVNRESTH